MKKNVNIIDTCGCPNWAKKLLKTVVQRTKIQANEIVIWDFTYKRIEMRAEIWDEDFGGWIEKNLTLKYYEDAQNPFRLMLSYSFFDNEEAMNEIVLDDGRICSYKGPTYLDEGAYRIFAYWCIPILVRIKD